MPTNDRDRRYASGSRSAYNGRYAGKRRRRRRRAKPQFYILVALLVGLIVFGIYKIVNSGGGDEKLNVVSSNPTAAPTVIYTQAPTWAPDPTPTPEPTPEPPPEPTQIGEHDVNYETLSGVPQTNRQLGIQESAAVDDSFFDDAVFVGDSVSLKLYYYVKKVRQDDSSFMGGAQFLTAGSLGSGNALNKVSSDSVHPTYQGTKMLVEDAIARMGVGKVYIMLGMNDIALYGIDTAVDNMMHLIYNIKKQSPDVEIFVQSATPRLLGDYQKLNNNALFEYDLKLFAACVDKGYHFVDVAYVMRDELGNLPAEYCSDPDAQALHFTDKACRVWVEYLRTHTGSN